MSHHDRDLSQAFDLQAARFERGPIQTDPAALGRLVGFASLPVGSRVLDCGCGPGLVAEALLAAGCEVTGVDLSGEMVRRARARCARFGDRARFEQGSVFDLDVGEGFDAAVSRYVLHHVRDPLAFVQRQRVLVREGGLVIASDHTCDPDPDRARWHAEVERARDRTHTRNLSPGELVDLFARAGLRDVALVEDAFEIDSTSGSIGERLPSRRRPCAPGCSPARRAASGPAHGRTAESRSPAGAPSCAECAAPSFTPIRRRPRREDVQVSAKPTDRFLGFTGPSSGGAPRVARSAAGVRRSPRQARSRELVEAVVEAGLQVLREEGPEALTTRRIAERAGVSIGSLYQYFADKEAILEAVYQRGSDRFWSVAVSQVPTVAARSLPEAITLIAETAIDRHRRLYDLHPQYYFKRAARFALSTFNAQSREPATRFITMILECHRDALAIPSPERAAFMLTRSLGALLVRTLHERPHYLSDPAFLEDVVRMLRGLLVAEGRSGA